MMQETAKRSFPAFSLWVLAAGVALIFLVSLRPLAHPDIWTHLAQGRAIAESGLTSSDSLSFLTEGKFYTQPNWLYDFAVYGLYQAGGSSAVLLIHALLFSVGFGFLAVTALRWAHPLATAAILLLIAWLLPPVLIPGSDAVAVAWTGFLFWFFSSRRPLSALALLGVLQVLIVHLGAGYLVTPFFVLVSLLSLLFNPRLSGLTLTQDERRYATGLGILLLVAIGMFFLFWGGGLWSCMLLEIQRAQELRYFHILGTPATGLFKPSILRHLGVIALLIGALGLITLKQRLPLLATLAAFLGAFLLVQSPFLLIWFAVLSFPFLCLSLQSISEFIPFRSDSIGGIKFDRIAWTGILILMTYTGLVTLLGVNPRTIYLPQRFGLGETPELFSLSAAQDLQKKGVLPERLFHIPYDGGPLAWGLPGHKIFMDHRHIFYTKENIQRISKILEGEPIPAPLIKEWNVDSILLNCTWPRIPHSIAKMLKDPNWKLMYFNGTAALLVQSTSPSRARLEASGIREIGNAALESEVEFVSAQLQKGLRPGYRPRLAGAAGLFNALGHDAEAVRLYGLLVLSCPELLAVRQEYAYALLRTGAASAAEREFNKVVKDNPKNLSAWQGLSLALSAQGRKDSAQEAAQRVEKLRK